MADSLPAHFYLAPSSSSRWINCPGSLREAAAYPDEAGEAAAIGTLGHYLVEIDILDQPLAQPQREFLESLSDEVRKRLIDHVDICVALVNEIDAKVKLYETKIQSDLLEEHGGTVDVIAFDGETLHVIDFKFGRVLVDHEDNAQIKCYLVLARQMFPEAKRFKGSIIQPVFSREMRTHEYTEAELLDHEAKVLEASITDHLKAGDHCLYCPALIACKEAARHLREQVEQFPDLTKLVGEVKNEKPTPEQLEHLCKMYRTFKLAEKATKGAGEVLKHYARIGEDIAAHGLGVTVRRNTVWNDNAVEVLEDVIGDLEDCYKLKTPNQVREAHGMTKEEFEEVLERGTRTTESTSLVIGKGFREFPEFPDE